MTTAPKIALTEVFAAPQGEGYHAGRWSVFVRLAGCSLACEFSPGVVCDTPYMTANMKVTLDELFEDILPEYYVGTPRRNKSASPMLVITGGEPLMCPQFNDLMHRVGIWGRGRRYVAVETNGMYWRGGLLLADWISVSPKVDVPQTSSALTHNPNPKSPELNPLIINELVMRQKKWLGGGEYRYVISRDSPMPLDYAATHHYVSPAVLSSGSGTEWKTGFPGFSRGAVERCLEIIKANPRWRISTQIHKVLGVR